VRRGGRLRGFLVVNRASSSTLDIFEILVSFGEDTIGSPVIWVGFDSLGLAFKVDEAVARAYDGGAITPAIKRCLRTSKARRFKIVKCLSERWRPECTAQLVPTLFFMRCNLEFHLSRYDESYDLQCRFDAYWLGI
jgi:hypothetical protein